MAVTFDHVRIPDRGAQEVGPPKAPTAGRVQRTLRAPHHDRRGTMWCAYAFAMLPDSPPVGLTAGPLARAMGQPDVHPARAPVDHHGRPEHHGEGVRQAGRDDLQGRRRDLPRRRADPGAPQGPGRSSEHMLDKVRNSKRPSRRADPWGNAGQDLRCGSASGNPPQNRASHAHVSVLGWAPWRASCWLPRSPRRAAVPAPGSSNGTPASRGPTPVPTPETLTAFPDGFPTTYVDVQGDPDPAACSRWRVGCRAPTPAPSPP